MAEILDPVTRESINSRVRRSNMSMASNIAALIGIIFVTIGLGGIRTFWVGGLAMIAVGIAQMFEGEALGKRLSGMLDVTGRAFDETGVAARTGRLPVGIVCFILGVISLFNVAPGVTLPLGVILYGLVLILGAWETLRLDDMYTASFCVKAETRGIARAAIRSAVGLEVVLGFASLTLGCLGLAAGDTVISIVLALVALALVAFSSLMNSTLFSSQVLSNLYCEKVII